MADTSNNIHCQPSTTGWENQQNGIVLSRHFTKRTAVAKGRKLATHLATDLTIHGRDGTVLTTSKYTTPISVAAK
jgi:hypothetical protein